MQKSSWLMTMVGLFLAAALIWAVPVCAQPYGGGQAGMGRGLYGPGYGPGCAGGGQGLCGVYNNPQAGPGSGYGRQNRGRYRARWNNNAVQTPANPQPQTQPPAPQSGN
jgi:hypothetical protein